MDYYSNPAISNSKLSTFKQSPQKFKWALDNKQEETAAMLIGNATHRILFEPETLSQKFFILDEKKKPEPDSDYRNKRNQLWRSDQIALNEGKDLLSSSDYDMIMFMQEALFKHDVAKELIRGCLFEHEIYWKDKVMGLIDCKSKLDGLKPGQYIIDYKTTANADPWVWQKDAWKRDYYRQAGFYYDAADEVPFYFIAQEKTAPYPVSIHKCTQDAIDYGRNEYRKLLTQLRACMETDCWPGYEIKNNMDYPYFDFDVPEWAKQLM